MRKLATGLSAAVSVAIAVPAAPRAFMSAPDCSAAVSTSASGTAMMNAAHSTIRRTTFWHTISGYADGRYVTTIGIIATSRAFAAATKNQRDAYGETASRGRKASGNFYPWGHSFRIVLAIKTSKKAFDSGAQIGAAWNALRSGSRASCIGGDRPQAAVRGNNVARIHLMIRSLINV
jgi:hypothetical protein